MLDTQLDGRTALVTGGAGAIGAALCERLAAAGANVAVVDADAPRLEATTASLAPADNILAVHSDLTEEAGVDAAVAAVQGAFGHVDVLVNGVGEHLASAGPFEESSEATWQALYEVNLLHVFRMTKALLAPMRQRRWGRIVNFSSVEGIRSAPALAVYTAFKAAVDAFTRSVAVDAARDGVLVNAVAVDKTRAYQTGHYALPDDYEDLVPTFIPAGRYAEPEDVAEIALFLAGGCNRWIVGQTIVADGGTLAAGGWYRTPVRWTNQPVLAQYVEDPEANLRRPPMLQ